MIKRKNYKKLHFNKYCFSFFMYFFGINIELNIFMNKSVFALLIILSLSPCLANACFNDDGGGSLSLSYFLKNISNIFSSKKEENVHYQKNTNNSILNKINEYEKNNQIKIKLIELKKSLVENYYSENNKHVSKKMEKIETDIENFIKNKNITKEEILKIEKNFLSKNCEEEIEFYYNQEKISEKKVNAIIENLSDEDKKNFKNLLFQKIYFSFNKRKYEKIKKEYDLLEEKKRKLDTLRSLVSEYTFLEKDIKKSNDLEAISNIKEYFKKESHFNKLVLSEDEWKSIEMLLCRKRSFSQQSYDSD